MSQNNPKKNYIYNIVYQILTLIIPITTAPYLSRVLGASGVGIYSYTYSIVYYFMLLTLLGVNNYGNRTIAKVRESDKKILSKEFWSIYFLQLLMGIVMIFIYLFYILIFEKSYKIIALIQTLFILSSILDVNWFFFGMEEFKKTIVRNTFIKICNTLLIFLIVKDPNDLWKYTLIMSGMTLLSQAIMWTYLKKYIEIVKISWKEIKKHFKPNFILFIPVIAVSIYKIMDKIMLGAISSVVEVGYYENADKIIHVPLSLIVSLGTVMLPRISNLMSKGNKEKANEYIKKSINFVMFLSVAMCFGLIAIGYNFAPIFFGNEFQKTGILIILLSITIPFYSFANVIRTQYLIPNEKDNIYIKSVILGAITNLIMNIIFIPRYNSIGACIGTISAEAIVMMYQCFKVRREISIKEYIIDSIPFFVKSLIMFLIIYPLNYIQMNSLIRICIQVILGITIYGILNLKYINNIINIKSLFKKILKKEKKA